MISLPTEFQERMLLLLGDEFDELLRCYEKPSVRGIRRNPLKCTEETLTETLPFSLKESPFSPLGYEIPSDVERVGTLPLHHAGAFYVQEPSASSAVTVLAPQPGDKVLDLCAAPGGKSTQIAGLLGGEGLLWSNEFVKNRAKILLSNLERLGVANSVVSSCHPEQLCSQLTGFFDKVLVDAPCSGEGMFRRDTEAVAAWSPEHVEMCAVRQLSILDSAAKALAPGGVLVYSTCTYAVEENEDVVGKFLGKHPEFTLLDCDVSFGRPSQILPKTRRIFPMDGGDGHFIAKLQKNDGPSYTGGFFIQDGKSQKEAQKQGQVLFEELSSGKPTGKFSLNGNNLYLLPPELPRFDGLYLLRAGVQFGECKKNRIEPAHHFFMAANPQEMRQLVTLTSQDDNTARYLRGEEIPVSPDFKGYAGVAVDGVMLGFGKCSGGKMKNHYPKGLRNLG